MDIDPILRGAGRYDDLAILARETTEATGVLLIIDGGLKGSGISVHGEFPFIAGLPEMLESLAAQFRDNARFQGQRITN